MTQELFVKRRSRTSKMTKQGSSKSTKFVQMLFAGLCTFGCIYNAYQIVTNYLEYEVTAEAWFFSTSDITPPMVTVCISGNYKKPCKDNCYNTTGQFFDKTYNFSEVVEYVDVHQEPFGQIAFKDIRAFQDSEVNTFGIYDKICYGIEIAEHNKTNISYSLNYVKSLLWRGMLAINFNCTACNRENRPCEVVIASPASLFVEPVGKQAMSGFLNIFSYKHTELHLMPPPYATKCRDYKREGIFTQEDCFSQCLKQQSLKNLSFITNRVPFFQDENIPIKINEQVTDRILNFCKRDCRDIACEIHKYVIDVDREKQDGNDTYVVVDIPLDGKIHVNYKAKTNFWDFMTLFGSVFGFWFGVSAFGLLEPLMKVKCHCH